MSVFKKKCGVYDRIEGKRSGFHFVFLESMFNRLFIFLSIITKILYKFSINTFPLRKSKQVVFLKD